MDNLLRAQKLVDLYKVVREGIRVSEPRYSIKNIEHFYLEQPNQVTSRMPVPASSITNAGRKRGDPQLLKDIEDYNLMMFARPTNCSSGFYRCALRSLPWAKDSR